MMVRKLIDSAYILILALYCPYILKMFRFPVTPEYQGKFAIVGIIAILFIWLQGESQDSTQVIEEVFRQKNVKIGDKYPTVRRLENEEE